jgi:cbb3-type cytochrome oxidase subunit 3
MKERIGIAIMIICFIALVWITLANAECPKQDQQTTNGVIVCTQWGE